MAFVSFTKGLMASLPATYAEGTFYVTTDERAIYLDVSDSARIRIGDFQEVANIAALASVQNPSTTALYYATAENILAKYNGSSWVQINPDTGATSIEVTGKGNAVTAASYDDESRKLTLTMGTTFAVPADITAAVGELGDKEEGVPYANVKEYVDEKIADVVAGSIEGLGALASKDEVAESDLEATLAEKINGKADTTYVDGKIAALDKDDAAVEGQVVSAVSETDGVITVTRRSLVAADIPEIAQSKVTGLETALAGKQDTVVFNTTYNAESNKAATMQDVQNAVADLSGAMHYEGESTSDPSAGTITIEGKPDYSPASGDVVTYNAKEYVYDGENWRELGDESSFAVKGSIKNADIAADAAIDQSKIAGLTDALAAKASASDLDALEALVGETAVGTQITNAIGALDKADSAVENQFVTAVSEADGVITVSRAALTEANIPALGISKITDLQTTLDGKQATVAFNGAYNASTNKAAVMSDVTAAETNAKSYADGLASNYDAAGSADAALEDAKEYTDTALTWGSF